MRDQASKLRQLMYGEGTGVSTEPQPIDTAAGSAHVIAVTSGKGGVGKTTFAVNLALLLAERPAKVLLVDGDLGLANVDVMLGMEPGKHIGHLLLEQCAPEEVAANGPCGIKVISGGSGLRELADAGHADRLALMRKLREYSRNFDYVVIDTSPGIGMEVVDFLREADDILLLTTSEPTSLRDAYAAFKTISQEMPDKEIIPVVNCATGDQARQAMEALNQVMRKFLGRQCDSWHQVDSDPMVARTIRDRKSLVRSYPRSPAAVCLRRLAKTLMGKQRNAEPKLGCVVVRSKTIG